jgi:hypothetical protein
MSPRQSALSVIKFLPRDWRNASLCCSHILRCRGVGISEPIESGIAIDAAKRTDSDCAEKILLHGTVPMRPKYLRTAAMWTKSFGVRLHFLSPQPRFSSPKAEKQPGAATWVTILQHIRQPPAGRRAVRAFGDYGRLKTTSTLREMHHNPHAGNP